MKTLKQHIAELIEKGISQRKIAQSTGVSESSISRVKSGEYADLQYMDGRKIEELNVKVDLLPEKEVTLLEEAQSSVLSNYNKPVAYRYWSNKFQCWEYSAICLEFPDVPAGTNMEPLYR